MQVQWTAVAWQGKTAWEAREVGRWCATVWQPVGESLWRFQVLTWPRGSDLARISVQGEVSGDGTARTICTEAVRVLQSTGFERQ